MTPTEWMMRLWFLRMVFHRDPIGELRKYVEISVNAAFAVRDEQWTQAQHERDLKEAYARLN
jgi:hypothetical protein